MAKVIPVGPIDPVLYGFAKKQAEKAERDPRYVPKNCPAEMGRIIYRRIGGMVKALVFVVTELIGMHKTNIVSTYIPYKNTLRDNRYEDIQTYSNVNETYGAPVRVDGYGDWYHPTYSKTVSELSKGFADLGWSASAITVTTTQAQQNGTQFTTLYFSTGSSNLSYTHGAETIIRFHDKYLDNAESCNATTEPESDDPPPHHATNKAICLRANLKVEVVHELTIKTTTSGGQASTSSNNNGAISGFGSMWDDIQSVSEIYCGRKDEKFLVLYLRTDSQISNGYSTGGPPYNTIAQTATYTLVVNGSESLSKTKEPDHQAALAVRIDGGGLAYLIYAKNNEQDDRARVFPELTSTYSAYGTISNKYGVFVVVGDSKEKKRKRQDGTEYTSRLRFSRIAWIRPKEKHAKDEDAIHLLDDGNSEIIIITPREPPKFGEQDGEDYPQGDEPSWDYSYMLFASTADKNTVVAIDNANIVDVTTIIKKYLASKGTDDEMTVDDVDEWRGATKTVGANGQAKMPHEAGSGGGRHYMKPGLMHRPARNLIDALYFPTDNP